MLQEIAYALKARRIVLVTPYVTPVIERKAAYFAHNGFEVLAAVGNGIDSNWGMAQAPPQTWYDPTLANSDDRADAYVLSCGLTAAATHWLADRGSRMHGVEGPSTDRPNSPSFPSHRVCRDRGISHYEWLCNLEELLGKGEFQFQGIPLKFKRGSGSPVRALAFLD